MIQQSTLAAPVTIEGIGLHSGAPVRMELRPAEADNGIVFYRRENDRCVAIRACSENVIDTRLATVIGREGLSVSTIEHLMAALAACGIDNLDIDIDGPEVPIMDGSAAPFIAALHQVGVRNLDAARKFLSIKKPLTLVEGEKRISIIPSRFFRISFDIAFDHPSIALQHYSVKVTGESFRQEIAEARTFGFLHEVEYLKANGLARGGSLENAIVIGEDGVLNPEGLRYENEFVRHKIADAVGDFSLLGYPLLGHIKAYKAGHDLNQKMVAQILETPDAWQLVEFNNEASFFPFRCQSRAFSTDWIWGKA